jgi:hypothetical protein
MTLYPEHEKQQAVREKSQVCGEFVEWLQQRGIHLAEWTTYTYTRSDLGGKEHEGTRQEMALTRQSLQDLLGKFFGIDPQKLEAEKREMLAAVREGH